MFFYSLVSQFCFFFFEAEGVDSIIYVWEIFRSSDYYCWLNGKPDLNGDHCLNIFF